MSKRPCWITWIEAFSTEWKIGAFLRSLADVYPNCTTSALLSSTVFVIDPITMMDVAFFVWLAIIVTTSLRTSVHLYERRSRQEVSHPLLTLLFRRHCQSRRFARSHRWALLSCLHCLDFFCSSVHDSFTCSLLQRSEHHLYTLDHALGIVGFCHNIWFWSWCAVGRHLLKLLDNIIVFCVLLPWSED